MSTSNKEAVINVRVTASEKEFLEEEAKKACLTLSAFSRRRLLGLKVIAHEATKERNELRRLAGLLKHIHNESGGAYSVQTKETLRLIYQRLKAIGA